jgi:hypothetical protein
MLTFLNATILFSLAAVLIPVLIHLLNRQRKKNIRFSTIRFLKILEKQRLKRLKLYQNGIGGSARTTAVIVLDDAVYMRRYDEKGNRFYRAQKKTQQILAQFNPQDQVFILSSHAPEKEIIDIKNTECSYASANWPGVFTRAGQIFSDHPNYNRELYIISDFQFREPERNHTISLENVRYYLFPIASGYVSNVSIDTVRFENTLFEMNNVIRFDAILRNHQNPAV